MNFLTSAPPKNTDTVTIAIYDVLVDSGSLAEYQGHKIYLQIVEAFEQGKSVILSFKHMAPLTWSFVTASLGHLSASFTEEQIETQLSLVDIPPEEVAFIQKVIQTRKEYRENPEKFNKPMSDRELAKLRAENPDNKWLSHMAGVFKDDPEFDEVLAYIEEYRRELDAEMEAYYRELDGEDEAK